MNFLSLFAGIGGFDLGLERAGMTCVAQCEIDDKCNQVLAKHWPSVKRYQDIKELTGEQLERDEITDIGLVCGGYPCQPFSVAGKREGEADDRHLWPEAFRLVKEIGPSWCLFENVTGHISMGLDSVLVDLESINYTCQTFVIPACAIDAFHRRDRIWIIANANELTNGQQYINETTRDECERTLSDVAHAQGERRGETREFSGRRQKWIISPSTASQDVADTYQKGLQEWQRKNPNRTGKKNWAQPERISQWLPEPCVGRVANGISGRVDRLKQLGNAVVPQIPEIIGRTIMEIENAKKM